VVRNLPLFFLFYFPVSRAWERIGRERGNEIICDLVLQSRKLFCLACLLAFCGIVVVVVVVIENHLVCSFVCRGCIVLLLGYRGCRQCGCRDAHKVWHWPFIALRLWHCRARQHESTLLPSWAGKQAINACPPPLSLSLPSSLSLLLASSKLSSYSCLPDHVSHL
jgi:hypothetical protein